MPKEQKVKLMILALFVLSLVGGFFAGLLGVGGAVVLIPLLEAVPPLLGIGHLTMSQISGITMLQVLAASISGYFSHKISGLSHTKTMLTIGIPMGVFSLLGATLSSSISNKNMSIIFGFLVAFAFALLLKKSLIKIDEDANDFNFNGGLCAVTGSCVGLVAGILGAGGGFILIPIMLGILKIPLRVTIGSSLGIVFIGALMGSIGKIITLQVEWKYIPAVVLGSIPASLFGAHISKKIPAGYIRYIFLLVVTIILVKTWTSILFS